MRKEYPQSLSNEIVRYASMTVPSLTCILTPLLLLSDYNAITIQSRPESVPIEIRTFNECIVDNIEELIDDATHMITSINEGACWIQSVVGHIADIEMHDCTAYGCRVKN
jgi:hypothetical protein